MFSLIGNLLRNRHASKGQIIIMVAGFAVGLIPYTQEHTNLLNLHPNDRVNLESDIIARYVEQLLDERYLGGEDPHLS